mgnify:FL=1|jgi:hypothetical protein
MPLMIFLLLTSCTSQGWIVGNLPVTPSDTVTNSVFIEVMDVDSTIHWYHGRVSDNSNWCYLHNDWETIRKQ